MPNFNQSKIVWTEENKMKKFVSIILALILCVSLMIPAAQAEKKLSVVAATFPMYDWTRRVIGDVEGIDLTLLLDSGVDLHSFNPTAADILKVATCDLFIYVGGESDEWVEDVMKQAVNPDITTLCLMEILGGAAKEEEAVEGMEEEEEEGEEEEIEYDEHVWLSLRNAALFVQAISDALSEKDAAHADTFAANAAAYIAALNDPVTPKWWKTPPIKRWCSATASPSAIWWMITA